MLARSLTSGSTCAEAPFVRCAPAIGGAVRSLGATSSVVRAAPFSRSARIRAALGVTAKAPLAERVLTRVREAGSVDATGLAEPFAAPRTTLGRLLRALVEAGDRATSGQGKATRYQVAVRVPEASADSRHHAALDLRARDGRLTRAGFAADAGVPLRSAWRARHRRRRGVDAWCAAPAARETPNMPVATRAPEAWGGGPCRATVRSSPETDNGPCGSCPQRTGLCGSRSRGAMRLRSIDPPGALPPGPPRCCVSPVPPPHTTKMLPVASPATGARGCRHGHIRVHSPHGPPLPPRLQQPRGAAGAR
jgi:hypothetical protein